MYNILQSQLFSSCWPLALWINHFLFQLTDGCIYLSIKTLGFTLLKDKLEVSLPSNSQVAATETGVPAVISVTSAVSVTQLKSEDNEETVATRSSATACNM